MYSTYTVGHFIDVSTEDTKNRQGTLLKTLTLKLGTQRKKIIKVTLHFNCAN